MTSKPPHGGGGHAPHQAPPHRSAAPHSAHGGRTASKAGPLPVPPPPSTKLPRSPRAALEPESVPLPKRRSRRVRHPLVIVGNAIFTVLIVVSIAVGGALYLGKQRFEAPGPLTQDKIVNIPRGLGIRDIADLLAREGVIDQPWVFVGGVLVLKARGDLKHGEYQLRQKRKPRRRGRHHRRKQGGAARADHPRGAHLRTDRRKAVGERRALGPDQGNPARRHAAAGNL